MEAPLPQEQENNNAEQNISNANGLASGNNEEATNESNTSNFSYNPAGPVLRHKPRRRNLVENVGSGLNQMRIEEEDEDEVEKEEVRASRIKSHMSIPTSSERDRMQDQEDGPEDKSANENQKSFPILSDLEMEYELKRSMSIIGAERSLLHALNVAKAVSPHDPLVVLFSRVVADAMAVYSLLQESPEHSQLIEAMYNSMADTLHYYADQHDCLNAVKAASTEANNIKSSNHATPPQPVVRAEKLIREEDDTHMPRVYSRIITDLPTRVVDYPGCNCEQQSSFPEYISPATQRNVPAKTRAKSPEAPLRQSSYHKYNLPTSRYSTANAKTRVESPDMPSV